MKKISSYLPLISVIIITFILGYLSWLIQGLFINEIEHTLRFQNSLITGGFVATIYNFKITKDAEKLRIIEESKIEYAKESYNLLQAAFSSHQSYELMRQKLFHANLEKEDKLVIYEKMCTQQEMYVKKLNKALNMIYIYIWI